MICGGTLRGDSQYGPGKIGLGDILGTFAFSLNPLMAQRSSRSTTPSYASRYARSLTPKG